MPGTFTVSQFKRWDAAIPRTSPGEATKEDIARATLVTGIVLQGIGDGVVLRLTDETGETRTFNLNAAMAMRLADVIPLAGLMKDWLRPDGTINALPDSKR
jgi:hypothetical protein